jgi:hypothetical protein
VLQDRELAFASYVPSSIAVAEDVGETEMIDAAASAASEADTQQLSQLHRRRS